MASHVTPSLIYRDPMAAFAWLEKAFGLQPTMLITTPDGALAHSEMRYGDGAVMIGSEWSSDHKSPASVGGKNTQSVRIHMIEDIDAHCERARAAGAEIMAEPDNQFYGDRVYRARDLEGHIWTFAQSVESVAPEVWEKSMGLKLKAW